MEGILSRAILKQAKPNISAQQYANIEHIITRSEMLVKWFTGSFAKACEAHDYDFLKEVQRVARFKEYTKSDSFRELDGLFFDMSEVFRGSYVRGRAEKALSGFHSDRKRNSIAVFRHFRKTVNQLERDSWGVSTSELTLVGDSLYDARTAENAGCHCILVTWGYANIRDIHNWGAPTCGTVEELRRLTLSNLV